MNWYRKEKLASPIINISDKPPYSGLAHEGWESTDYDKEKDRYFYTGKRDFSGYKQYIWIIDRNWDFYSHDALDYSEGEGRPVLRSHMDLFGSKMRSKNFYAAGRYEQSDEYPEGAVSMQISLDIEKNFSIYQADHIIKRVEEILDEKFNNPIIMRYGDSKSIKKYAQSPIGNIFYNPEYWELKVKFKSGPKVYIYQNVSPYIYERFRALLSKQNYSKAIDMLKNLSKQDKNKEPELREQLELF